MTRPVVLLVNPNRMRPPIGPIGLEYLAEGLTHAGFEPWLCDLTFAYDWRQTLDDALEACRPLAVGISIRNLDDAYFASQDFILEASTEIVSHVLETAEAPVVLGGVGFSIAPCEVLSFTGADCGIVGEGEEAFPKLLRCIEAAEDVSHVPGAVFRDENGEVALTPPVAADTTAWPVPDRRFAENLRYFEEGGQAGIETQRGCAAHCIYCVEPYAKGKHLRLHTPERVVAECRSLLEQGIDALHLCDSEVNRPPDHLRAVCEALDRAGLGDELQWYAYAFPVPFDADLAQAMKRAGCAGIDFGVDHVDPVMLRRLGRHYTVEDVERTAQACSNAGLTVMYDLLLGGPGETRESLAQAIDALRGMPVDRFGLSCGVRVYPHTALADQVKKQGKLAANPNLQGVTQGNEDLLAPIFYVDAGLGGEIHGLVSEVIGDDPRFLHADPAESGGNYNYNDNSVLSIAIRDGARGAYWDILRKLDEA